VLLLHHDPSAAILSGVLSWLNRHFLKTGRISRHFGRFYADLYASGERADYVIWFASPRRR
jgi:uncharacterized protein (UPF0332 family)